MLFPGALLQMSSAWVSWAGATSAARGCKHQPLSQAFPGNFKWDTDAGMSGQWWRPFCGFWAQKETGEASVFPAPQLENSISLSLSLSLSLSIWEKEMAAHFSILAWSISWTAEPGGPQSMGSQRVRYSLATKQQWSVIYLCLSVI